MPESASRSSTPASRWARREQSIARTMPGVHKAVRLSSPMDGIKGQAWVVSFALLPAAADVERQAHSNMQRK